MTKKKPSLGRGLSALLETEEVDARNIEDKGVLQSDFMIPLDQIVANPYQPRLEFDDDTLRELADSILIHGVIQPITVRKAGKGRYEIISGERRVRASILAGLEEIPAHIRLANDQEMVEMALIENIQREDLNAIEVSLSYQRLMNECGLRQEELGERVGKKRSTVNNYLRLLKLPDDIQAAVKKAKITMGHARALINIDDPDDQKFIYNKVLKDDLTVRQTEALVRKLREQGKEVASTDSNNKAIDTEPYLDIIDELSHKLKSQIKLNIKKGESGSLIINFITKKQLDSIISYIKNK